MTGRRLPGLRLVQTCAGTLGVALAMSAPSLAADASTRPVTFSKDVAPIFQAKCQECHQPNSIAPMSLITFQEARPWARSIKQRVDHAPDAAVAHRPERRRAEVQERHVADRRADRHDRALGRCGAPAGRPEGPAAGQAARHRQRMAGRARRLRPARPRDQVVRVHDAGAAPGRVVPADDRHPAHRAALGQDGGDPSDQSEGPPDRPPLDRLSGAEQRSRGGEHRHGQRLWRARRPIPSTISSTAVRS